eukprot:TRINITY_DN2530_c0_g1_i2.p1 TRINITY_DN2530_c0_g1~~TRINITY_DN2530_c0_g1_i2.p1  ORF type:complete len:207 (+),score=74.03 TRINITY_DN2530_c0_g1_i2:59-679(+)
MGNCKGTPQKSTHNVRVSGDKRKPPPLESGVKLVLLGDMSTGKTSLVSRLTRNQFLEKQEATIGAAFQVHKMNVDGRDVKLEIWDTAGQERYRSLTPMYYRGASAAIIVYDITNKDSFDMMKRWVEELKVRAPPHIVIALAANKVDLAEQRMVPVKMAEDYLRQIEEGGGERPIFVECSAKTGERVPQLFGDMCRKLISVADSGSL